MTAITARPSGSRPAGIASRLPAFGAYERRALISCLVAAAVLLSGLAFLFATSIAAVVEQRRTLARLEQTIERAAALGAAGTIDPDRAQIAKRLFAAATASEFQSQLQSHIKEFAARHGSLVEAMQVMRTERQGQLTRLTLRVDATIPQATLGPLLADLAAGAPLVLLQTFKLRPVARQANRLNNGGQPDQAVSARIDFVAFAATGRSAGSPDPARGGRDKGQMP
jgi:hypothetical protein